MTNTHPTTGIRYGYIRGDSLDQELVQGLLYDVGTNLTYLDAVNEFRKVTEAKADSIEDEVNTALIEGDYHITNDPEYERIYEDAVDRRYEELGFDGRDDFIERTVEAESEYLHVEEPSIEGEYAGVSYMTSWLGGALNFWVFESPVTGLYQQCSPCVPNAGNLDCPDIDGVLTYDVPADWRMKEI